LILRRGLVGLAARLAWDRIEAHYCAVSDKRRPAVEAGISSCVPIDLYHCKKGRSGITSETEEARHSLREGSALERGTNGKGLHTNAVLSFPSDWCLEFFSGFIFLP
jgi:hypothetical protein